MPVVIRNPMRFGFQNWTCTKWKRHLSWFVKESRKTHEMQTGLDRFAKLRARISSSVTSNSVVSIKNKGVMIRLKCLLSRHLWAVHVFLQMRTCHWIEISRSTCTCVRCNTSTDWKSRTKKKYWKTCQNEIANWAEKKRTRHLIKLPF